MATHTQTKEIVLTENDIDAFVSKHVRPQSQEFYRHDIKVCLREDGETIVDHHAGNGIFWKISRHGGGRT